MTRITLFTAPKPFTDPRIAAIQNNAIASWTRLRDVDVLLMGDEDGLERAADRHGVGHVPGVDRNQLGTPLVSSMVHLAKKLSQDSTLCLINADIILMSDFVDAAQAVTRLKSRFVLVGRRWDLDIRDAIDFGPDWESRLKWAARERGVLHRPAGSDMFLFPRSCYAELPAFAIGRSGWDNWMIFKARREHWPVVDGTPSLTMIHQNHDYSHLPGGETHHTLPETDENIRLAGGDAAVRYTIVDATHRLVNAKLARPPMSYVRFWRGLELLLRRILFFLPPETIERVVRPRRWKRQVLKLMGMQ